MRMGGLDLYSGVSYPPPCTIHSQNGMSHFENTNYWLHTFNNRCPFTFPCTATLQYSTVSILVIFPCLYRLAIQCSLEWGHGWGHGHWVAIPLGTPQTEGGCATILVSYTRPWHARLLQFFVQSTGGRGDVKAIVSTSPVLTISLSSRQKQA